MIATDLYDEVSEALQYIDPSIPREEWARVGMALKAELGDGGFDLFNEWSKDGGNYNEADTRSTWRSIKAGGGVTIKTLFRMARDAGYRSSGNPSPRMVDPEVLRQREEASRLEREAQQRQYAEGASKAAVLFQRGRLAGEDHPYLLRQKVRPTETLREIDIAVAKQVLGYHPSVKGEPMEGRLLLAPFGKFKDGKRYIASVEMIDEKGRKAGNAGGERSDGYWSAAKLPDGDGEGITILIGEGVATVCSARQATEHHAVAALSSSNLKATAQRLSENYPKASLVILADIGNGQSDAEKAAQAVGCRIAFPVLPKGAGKDFNDQMKVCGAESVRAVIEAADTLSAWANPEPFDDSLPPVPKFEFMMLPQRVRAYVQDAAERMQCPPDFVAVSMMTAIGAVIGRRVGIRPKRDDDWTEYPNLWGMLIGRPSMKKSPAMAAGFAGLHMLEKKATANFDQDMEQYQQQSVLAEIRNKEIKSNIQKQLRKDLNAAVDVRLDEPVAPNLVRYSSNKFSPEAVTEVLRHNPNGILCHRDELIGILKSWDKDGQEDARSLFLQGWSGKMPLTTDLIGRGLNLRVPAVCLSVFGTTQPGVIGEFVRAAVKGGSGDDGLIQRFGLMVYPDPRDESDIRFIDQRPNLEARREMESLFEYIADATMVEFGAEQGEFDSTPFLRLDDEAYGMFRDWSLENERRIAGGDLHPAMESHLSKYPKLLLGLALICHIANGGKGAVNGVAMLQALSWLEYLEPHAHRVFFTINNGKNDAAKSLLKRIAKGELVDGFTVRDVYRKGWVGLTTPEEAQQAIDQLVSREYLKPDHAQSTGRPTVRYLINPRGSS